MKPAASAQRFNLVGPRPEVPSFPSGTRADTTTTKVFEKLFQDQLILILISQVVSVSLVVVMFSVVMFSLRAELLATKASCEEPQFSSVEMR